MEWTVNDDNSKCKEADCNETDNVTFNYKGTRFEDWRTPVQPPSVSSSPTTCFRGSRTHERRAPLQTTQWSTHLPNIWIRFHVSSYPTIHIRRIQTTKTFRPSTSEHPRVSMCTPPNASGTSGEMLGYFIPCDSQPRYLNAAVPDRRPTINRYECSEAV